MTLGALPFVLALALHGCDGSDGTDSPGNEFRDLPESSVEQADADGDTIRDIDEGEGDEDGDGTPNYKDDDSDGDSISDRLEAGDDHLPTLPVDSDKDGIYDFLDLDSDGNCIADAIEAGRSDGGAIDTDEDSIHDFRDTDNDGDGILDIDENASCELPTDTDADGLANLVDLDSDGDGISDFYEGGRIGGDPVDTDGDTVPDFLDMDSDNDGLVDSAEGGTEGDLTREPLDTDSDGRYDYADTDADGDALPDATEIIVGTDPYDSDTDEDGHSDGAELTAGTDPLDPRSVPDAIYVVLPPHGTIEEYLEFDLSIGMGDIAFILDTTCSMGGTITAITTEMRQIMEDLSEAVPDAAYGVAGHEDYAYGSMGVPGTDKPFYLRQQVTTDLDAVEDALSSLSTHSGADAPQSGIEALYQAASGAGYDQDCDGTYDSSTDVYPFLASKDDPFFGAGGEYYEPDTMHGGTIGGFGFREYALPIIVVASDSYLRDPESLSGYYSPTPGGCPIDAGMSDAVSAFSDIGARFVGISVNGTTGYPQMIAFAQSTGSYADLDGDGDSDEEVVQTWSGSNAAFRETIVEAITELIAGTQFSRVELSVEGDAYGFVTSIDPAYYEDLGAGDTGSTVEFTVTFRSAVAETTEPQLYKLRLNLLGDSTVLLATVDLILEIPGITF